MNGDINQDSSQTDMIWNIDVALFVPIPIFYSPVSSHIFNISLTSRLAHTWSYMHMASHTLFGSCFIPQRREGNRDPGKSPWRNCSIASREWFCWNLKHVRKHKLKHVETCRCCFLHALQKRKMHSICVTWTLRAQSQQETSNTVVSCRVQHGSAPSRDRSGASRRAA